MATGGNIELPHGRDGRLDYDTLGKMVTAHILGEVLQASFVDPQHKPTKDTHETSFKAATDWEYCYEKNNVTVLRKKSQHTCFMGRGVVDRPLKEIAEFYKDIQSTFLWDHLLVDARYVRQLSESNTHTDYIGYQMFETKQYCGIINLKRDMLYYARCIYTENGKYVQSGVSIEDPEFPLQSGVPRVELHFGSGFVLEQFDSDPNKTLISYLADLDVKQVPSIILKQVLKRHPMSIQNVRRYFSNPRSLTPRHLRMSSDNHGLLSSISTSASISPQKHSSLNLPYEEGTITKDFLGHNHSASLVGRRSPSPPAFIHPTKPLCFSSVYEPDSKSETQ